jgi:hypothetical protein
MSVSKFTKELGAYKYHSDGGTRKTEKEICYHDGESKFQHVWTRAECRKKDGCIKRRDSRGMGLDFAKAPYMDLLPVKCGTTRGHVVCHSGPFIPEKIGAISALFTPVLPRHLARLIIHRQDAFGIKSWHSLYEKGARGSTES